MPKIAIVGEAWGEHEHHLGHPFVGPAGRELLSQLVDAGILPRPVKRPFEPEAVRDFWLTQDVVSLHNCFNLRPERNDVLNLCTSAAGPRIPGASPLRAGKYVKTEYQPELERLARELAAAAPNLIIALGGTASWALLGEPGISRIRGAIASSAGITGVLSGVLSGSGVEAERVLGSPDVVRQSGAGMGDAMSPVKTLPTYHPAAVLRDFSLRAVTVLDLRKAAREAAYPEIRRPFRRVLIEPSLEDLDWFWHHHLSVAERISVDIETQGIHITCIGFAPSPDISLVVPFRDMRKRGWSFWPNSVSEGAAWRWVRKVCTSGIPLVFQNGMYDAHFLWKQAGIPTPVNEDTMLLHHSIYPELQKGLGFLGSVYTNEASWKLMNRSQSRKKDE